MESVIRIGDREITRIGLGTNRLRSENDEFVKEAVAAGIGMVDTAHVYTGGESERTIGDALGASSDRFVIATKGGYGDGEGRREVLRKQIDQSLSSLRTDQIFLYYLHRVHPETPLEESLGTIREYVDDGKIRHVGISAVGVEEIERARQIVPIAAVQNHYNLEERRHDDVVDHCEREGIAFVPYYPLKGDGPAALAEIAEAKGATPSQVKLAWLLRRSPATIPIPGTRSIEHLRENLGTLEVELTGDEFDALA